MRKTEHSGAVIDLDEYHRPDPSPFIGYDEIADGPRRDVIARVTLLSHIPFILELKTGTEVLVIPAVLKALVKAYGNDFGRWIGKEIELYGVQVRVKQNSVCVRPISPRDPADDEAA